MSAITLMRIGIKDTSKDTSNNRSASTPPNTSSRLSNAFSSLTVQKSCIEIRSARTAIINALRIKFIRKDRITREKRKTINVCVR